MDRTSRRKSRRYDVEGVEGCFVLRIDVDVINLSIAGMAIETTSTLIVGRRYSFTIHNGGRDLDVPGRVIWCVLGKKKQEAGREAPVFRAGVQFENVLSESGFELQHLIEQSAVFDPGTQVLGRFTAVVGETVDFEAQAAFEVKRISFSGMLVDTECAPRLNDIIPFEAKLGDTVLSGHGRVANIQQYDDDTSETRFRLGIEFTLLDEMARQQLEEYIGELVALDPKAESA